MEVHNLMEQIVKNCLKELETDVYRELSHAMDIVLKSARNSVFDEKSG
jgi:hypothetical protein